MGCGMERAVAHVTRIKSEGSEKAYQKCRERLAQFGVLARQQYGEPLFEENDITDINTEEIKRCECVAEE